MSKPFFDTASRLSRLRAIAKLSGELVALPLYLVPRFSYSVTFQICPDAFSSRLYLLQHFRPAGRFAISPRPVSTQVILWLLLVQLRLYSRSLTNLSIALALRSLLCLLLLVSSGILSLLSLTLMAQLLGSGFAALLMPPVAFVQGLTITLLCFKDV